MKPTSALFRSSSRADSIYATDSLQDEDPKRDSSVNLTSTASSSSGLSSVPVCSCGSVSVNSLSSSSNPSTMEDKYAVFRDINSPSIIFDNPGIMNLTERDDSSKFRNTSQDSNDINELSEIKSSTPVSFPNLDPLSNKSYVDKDFCKDITNSKQALKDFIGSDNASCILENEIFSNSSECLDELAGLTNKNYQRFIKDQDLTPPTNPTHTRSVPEKTELEPEFLNESKLFPQNAFFGETLWKCKNPFNPFLAKDIPGDPAPPPRLVSKISEWLPHVDLPPQLPSRVGHVPPPPLPDRKKPPPIDSTQGTLLSFDLDTVPLPPPLKLQKDPQLPSSDRNFAPVEKRELVSPRRAFSSQSSIEEKIKSYAVDLNTIPPPPPFELQQDSQLLSSGRNLAPVEETDLVPQRRAFSSQSSIEQKRKGYSVVSFKRNAETKESSKQLEICEINQLPPLPPKPESLARTRQSSAENNFITAAPSTSGSSASASTEFSKETGSSSSSISHSSDYSVLGSSSEALVSNSPSSQSDVFSQVNQTSYTPSSRSTTNEHLSPDSIFRRRSDPFDDEFFLNLRKGSDKLGK